jgi:predicted metalloprotease with PDZ domain
LLRFVLLLFLLLAFAPCAHANREYDVDFTVAFRPAKKVARITVTLEPRSGRAVRLDFRMPVKRYTDITADGRLTRDGHRITWIPPKAGGKLVYDYRIGTRRDNGAYDSRITNDWAVVRGDDLFPPVRVRTTRRTDSRSRLRFDLPAGWGSVETSYTRSRVDGDAYVIVNPKRRFDRPVGWIIAGDIGTRRDYIDGVEVVVAAPKGEGARRMDVIALLNWTMLEMRSAFGSLPNKMLIIRAGDPMWRGGLSAPRSFWLHADRPLLEENGTSPVLHEFAHAVTRMQAHKGADWIVEGIVEFYSLEILYRTGTISQRRYRKIVADLRRQSAGITSLRTSSSSGPRTSRAVLLLQELDREIKKKTDGARDIDDVTQRLMEIGKVRAEDLKEITERLLNGPCDTLKTPLLAGELGNPPAGVQGAAGRP